MSLHLVRPTNYIIVVSLVTKTGWMWMSEKRFKTLKCQEPNGSWYFTLLSLVNKFNTTNNTYSERRSKNIKMYFTQYGWGYKFYTTNFIYFKLTKGDNIRLCCLIVRTRVWSFFTVILLRQAPMRGIGVSCPGCRGLSRLLRYMLGYSLFPCYRECNLMYIKISVTLW